MRFIEDQTIPEPIRRAIRADRYRKELEEHWESLPSSYGEYRKPGRSFSASTLPRAARVMQLTARHDDEIEVEEGAEGFRLLGRTVHEILEEEMRERGALVEGRIGHVIGGVYVHGRFDLIDTADRRVDDYKVTSVYSYLKPDKDEYIAQNNILAWLARKNGIAIDKGRLCYILKDHRAREYQEGGSYPRHMFPTSEVPMWTDQETEDYILQRINHHRGSVSLPDDDLPLCTDKERWMDGVDFKAYRLSPDGLPGERCAHSSKSRMETDDWIAAKVEEARASYEAKEEKRMSSLKNPGRAKPPKPFDPPQFTVVEYSPPPPRCGYCDARPFCSQFRQDMLARE